MPANDTGCAILLADVVGSTPLYEAVGDDAALRQIAGCIDRIAGLVSAAGGEFIHSKGDDVLATFSNASAALRAVSGILAPGRGLQTAVRVGLHYGPIIRARDDIFGDAVNLTARLSATANPGEAIISQDFVDRLGPDERTTLRYLDAMSFKGKSQPHRIFTLAAPDQSLHTQIASEDTVRGSPRERNSRAVHVTLLYGGATTLLAESQSATIGRSPDCNIVIERQWVSRRHATVLVSDGRVRLAERSSSGTFISMQRGQEVFTRREDVLLLGSGTISPGVRLTSPDAQIIHFAIAY